MPKSRAKSISDHAWDSKTYKTLAINLSIADHNTIKQICRQEHIALSDYAYTLIIKDMASRGIRLEGTATRNVDDIINNKQ